MTFLRRATISPAAARTAEYVLMFGSPIDVHVNGTGVEVFVHAPPRATGPRFATLVTSGMSDTPLEGAIRRAELLLYARLPTMEHVTLLKRLAALPQHTDEGFDLHRLVRLGDRTFLLAPPPFRERVTSPFDDPLIFLWPIELHASEEAFLHQNGSAALVDRLYGEGPTPDCVFVDDPRAAVA